MSLPPLTCRFCRFHIPQGRRGGVCQQLGVPVQSYWEACQCAVPIFDRTIVVKPTTYSALL